MAEPDRRKVAERFERAVNMDGEETETWLDTGESHRVGQKKDGGGRGSIGHASGRRIAAILRSPEPERTDEDYRHMRKVAGFVARHRASSPATRSPRAGDTA